MAVAATRPGRGSFALVALGRLIALAAIVVALIIGAAIVLHVYAPDTTGRAVTWVHDAANWLTSPFHGMVNGSGQRAFIINWGVAAGVYLVGGLFIAGLLRRTGAP